MKQIELTPTVKTITSIVEGYNYTFRFIEDKNIPEAGISEIIHDINRGKTRIRIGDSYISCIDFSVRYNRNKYAYREIDNWILDGKKWGAPTIYIVFAKKGDPSKLLEWLHSCNARKEYRLSQINTLITNMKKGDLYRKSKFKKCECDSLKI